VRLPPVQCRRGLHGEAVRALEAPAIATQAVTIGELDSRRVAYPSNAVIARSQAGVRVAQLGRRRQPIDLREGCPGSSRSVLVAPSRVRPRPLDVARLADVRPRVERRLTRYVVARRSYRRAMSRVDTARHSSRLEAPADWTP